MGGKPKSYNLQPVFISLIVSAAILGWGFVAIDKMTLELLAGKLFLPLGRLMTVISLGLVLGEIIEDSGWTRRLGLVSKPVFRFAKLGDHCGATFITAFFSGTAANTMLAGFFHDEKIGRKELFLTNLLNHFPAYFLHLPTTLFIVLPLTGKAGALYFVLTFSALLLRCCSVLLYGHFFPPAKVSAQALGLSPAINKNANPSWRTRIVDKLPNRLLNIAVYVIPVYTAVFVFNSMGFFNLARDWLAGFVTHSFIPVESLSIIVISFVAEFTSGFAVAGALLNAGVLTTRQTALALLIGNIVASPMRALRHQLPRYAGIFSPGLGVELMLVGQSLRVLSLIITGGLFYLI